MTAAEPRTVTLAEFLLARIAEDEAEAQSAIDQRNADIYRGIYLPGQEPQPDSQGPTVWDDWTGGPGLRVGAERVLAECAAKRRIVENCQRARLACGTAPIAEQFSSSDGPTTAYWRGQDWVVRQLVSVYADHPDFDPEWSEVSR